MEEDWEDSRVGKVWEVVGGEEAKRGGKVWGEGVKHN